MTGGAPTAAPSPKTRRTTAGGPEPARPQIRKIARMKKEMLINVLQPEECRIAIVEDGVLEELYVERTSHESYTGNIYKGKIVNLEPAIQAAFVDFSVGRNGFLHVSDVEPQYYRRQLEEDADLGPRDRPREPRPPREEGREPRPRAASPEEGREPRPRGAAPRDPEDRYRERPDRSEKGRRDRSDRRFGEGLVEDWEAPPPPPRSFAPPAPPARQEPPRVEARRPAEPESVPEPPEAWPPRREERDRPAFGQIDEPRGRLGRVTHAPETPRPAHEPPGRPRPNCPRVAPTAPVPRSPSPPSRTTTSPASAPASRPSPSRKPAEDGAAGRLAPRRSRPPGPSRRRKSTPIEAERFAPPPDLDAEPIGEDLPGRRRPAGRAAIRSRGGEREPERPRARPRAVEPDVLEDRPAPAPDDEPARPRAAESEPRPRGRSRPRPAEADAPRPSAHDRAGEPGYVPRHKRVEPVPPGARREPDDDLSDDLDLDAEPEAATGEPGDRPSEGGKRRRRRRGRRRDRPEIGSEAKAPADADLDDLDLDRDLDDLDEDDELPPRPSPAARRHREAPPARREPAEDRDRDRAPSRDREDFDFGDDDDDDDDLIADRGLAAGPIDPDDEIDPELEEEIRREIEEITELELEMGLRATTEARPRGRGDAPADGGREPPGRPRRQQAADAGHLPPRRRGPGPGHQGVDRHQGADPLPTYISIPGLLPRPHAGATGPRGRLALADRRRGASAAASARS